MVSRGDIPTVDEGGGSLMPSFRVSRRTAILALIASIPAPETGWSVFTSPPAAAGSVTITYDALGNGRATTRWWPA